jgi:peptidoglycan DL-endopeptidase CwlO
MSRAALCTAALSVVVVLSAALLPATALAAPSPGDVEAQINDAWNALESTIEQYNLVHEQLNAISARIAGMEQGIAPLKAQVNASLASVGAMSARLYELGPGSLALLQVAGSTDFVDQLTTVEHLARDRNAEVATALATLDSYAKARQPVDALRSQLAVQDADLAARRAGIQSRLDQLQKLRLAASVSTGPPSGPLRPAPCPAEYYGDKGSRAAVTACGLIGKPYVWGAAGPDAYDCSGLTMVAWASVGVPLGHYTGWQWTEGRPVTRAELRPGDLVFWYPDLHHMGIYVGGGWVVHAPHTGDVVRMAPLDRGIYTAGYRRPG